MSGTLFLIGLVFKGLNMLGLGDSNKILGKIIGAGEAVFEEVKQNLPAEDDPTFEELYQKISELEPAADLTPEDNG